MRTIERFMNWLKRQKFWKVFLLACGFMLVWDFTVGMILYHAGAEFSQHVATNEDLFSNSLFFLPMVTMTALLEEIIFRWAPMLILSFVLIRLYRSGRLTKERFFEVEKYAILILTIVSGIVFGWVHGTVWNVLIQGVSGTLFMLLYLRIFFLRRDRGQRNRWQLVSLAESTLLHAASNLLLMVL